MTTEVVFFHAFIFGFTEESSQAKRLKEDVEAATESRDPSPPPMLISEALAQFFGTGEREMLQSEALSRVWDYIKANGLEVGGQVGMSVLCT